MEDGSRQEMWDCGHVISTGGRRNGMYVCKLCPDGTVKDQDTEVAYKNKEAVDQCPIVLQAVFGLVLTSVMAASPLSQLVAGAKGVCGAEWFPDCNLTWVGTSPH